MAETSTMMPLGTKAPDFKVESIDGEAVSLSEFSDAPALLVMFICNHCPYVKHVEQELGKLTSEYMKKGVAAVGISSNDTSAFPDDAPDGLREQAERANFEFPYLFDEDQEAAQAYGAACTPDFFLFDGDLKLVYRGRMDESRPRTDIPVTGKELRAALDAVLEGKPVPSEQAPSMGCSIKWKPGNEPK